MSSRGWKNHEATWNYYVSIGKIPKNTSHYDYILHHIDTELKTKDPDRYYEWRIEDVIPVTWAEHNAIHHSDTHVGYNKGMHWSLTEEQKSHHSGARNPNYGKHWKVVDGKRIFI